MKSSTAIGMFEVSLITSTVVFSCGTTEDIIDDVLLLQESHCLFTTIYNSLRILLANMFVQSHTK
jgi:hypothetical protein